MKTGCYEYSSCRMNRRRFLKHTPAEAALLQTAKVNVVAPPSKDSGADRQIHAGRCSSLPTNFARIAAISLDFRPKIPVDVLIRHCFG